MEDISSAIEGLSQQIEVFANKYNEAQQRIKELEADIKTLEIKTGLLLLNIEEGHPNWMITRGNHYKSLYDRIITNGK